MDNLCLGCMHVLEQGQEICPTCGYAQSTPAKEAYHLAPGTILNNKFLIGRVLGYGGFGVTYAGYDLTLNQRVAIKEYLPSEFSTRMPGSDTVVVYSGDAEDQFAAGYKSFMAEAQRLARFNSISGVVAINDIFSANNTSYIAMELLEGVTVKERIAKEGSISWQETLEIMTVVLETLSAVHKEQIIHRDIAPDNIFITNDGRIKLLDFGAARYATSASSKSLSVILKPGYAPEEQYRSRGDQGAWSDVYAAAATMYRMLTGVIPPESMERMANDTLNPLSKFGIIIPEAQENAIMNALAVDASERTRSAEEFLDELLSGTTTRNPITKKKRDEGRWPKWLKAVTICVPAVLIIVLAAFFLGFFDSITNRATLKEGKVIVPSVIKMSVEDASELLISKGLDVQIVDKRISDRVGQDLVMLQTPATGRIADKGTTVEIIVSAGDVEYDPDEVPDVQYKTIKDAQALFDQLVLTAEISYSYSNTVAKDLVISQSVSPGTKISEGMVISLVVSYGKKTYEMPEVVGKLQSDAVAQLESLGALVEISYDFDNEVAEDYVISQSVPAGTAINEGTSISLVVSKGKKTFEMPQVVGKLYSDARAQLESLNASVEFDYAYDSVVAADYVISQSVSAGTVISEGTKITLIISMGKRTFEMPQVVGEYYSDAQAQLESLGASVELNYAFDSAVAADYVVSQSVSAGTIISEGTKITLVISMGKRTFEMPLVVGEYYSNARSRLESYNASVELSYAYNETVAKNYVVSQSVSVGTIISEGTKITLVISKGRTPVVVPNVSGTNYQDAKTRLESLGLTVSLSFVHNESTSWGIVTAQSKAANTSVVPPYQITLTVSKGTASRIVTADEISNYPSAMYNRSPMTQYRYHSRTRGQITIKNGYSSYSGYTTLLGRTQYGTTFYGDWESEEVYTYESSGSTYYTVVTQDDMTAYYYWTIQGPKYEWMYAAGVGGDDVAVLIEIYAENRVISLPKIGYNNPTVYGKIDPGNKSYEIEVGSSFSNIGVNLGEIYVLERNGVAYSTSYGNFLYNGITMVCSYSSSAQSRTIYRQIKKKYQYTHWKWDSWSSFGSWSSWADTNNMPSDTDTRDYELESRTVYIVSGKAPN